MARGTIEHHNQAMVGIRLTKTLQERFEAAAIKTRKVNTETLARGWIDRSVEVGPLVGAMYHIRRAKPSGTVALLMPADQSEACLIEGQNLQGLVLGMLLALSGEVLGELFLKPCCSSGSALRWRGRPLLSLTWRRFRS